MKTRTKSGLSTRLAVLSLTIATLRPNAALALSYAAMTPEQVTAATDVWIHGRIVSASGPEIRKNDFGDSFRDITLQLQVLKATDETLSGTVTIRSETSFHRVLEPGKEVFAAFSRNPDGTFRPQGQLGLYGWIPLNGDVKTLCGPVSAATYWRWLCGLRYAADTHGQAKDEDLTFWEQKLKSTDMGIASLAIDFFNNLNVSPVTASQLFEIFLAEYDQASAATPQFEHVRYPTDQHLEALGATIANALQQQDPNVVAGLVLDFFEHDAAKLKFMQYTSNLDDSFLPLVQRASDPAVLARIPQTYDSCIRPDYTSFKLLPTAPSDAMDAWLWNIVRDPQAHGVREELQLAGVWQAMTNRKDKNLLPYLRKVISGTEIPAVASRENGSSAFKNSAKEMLVQLEQSALAREDRLAEWVQRIKRNDSSVLSQLAQEITPKDRFLIPELATLSLSQWNAANHSPPFDPAARIMRRLHDSVFIPILLEWTRASPEAGLLEALAACGEKATAVERAIPALSENIPNGDFRAFLDALQRKNDLLLFLGSVGDPELAKHIIPFTKEATLDPLAQRELALAKPTKQDKPFRVWQLRDAALVALTKSGHSNAVNTLEVAYKSGDIRVRFVTALALYSLGKDTGGELIEAYRQHSERSIPELEKRWSVDFAGGEIYFWTILYLKNPKLDDLFLERTTRSFDGSDRVIAEDQDFLDSHRAEVFQVLISHIEDSKTGMNDLVVDCLERDTQQKFGDRKNTSIVERQNIARQWKDYIASHARN